MTSRALRIVALSMLVLVACSAGAASMLAARRHLRSTDPVVPVSRTPRPLAAPFVMFRTLAPRVAHGRVAMVPVDWGAGLRHLAPLSCARVQYAGGHGLCLVQESSTGLATYVAYTFGADFVRRQRLELPGIPIRVRLSADGRVGAVTVYTEEESPRGERQASHSLLIEMTSGTVIADLREFTVDYGTYQPFSGPLDISGVSFQQGSDAFVATVTSGNESYLVHGSVAARRLDVFGAGLASEAVSDDGARVVAKKRIGPHGFWQLVVVNLQSGAEHPLQQGSRSIDDQVDWLDHQHVVYHDVNDEDTAIWSLAADGLSGPRVLIPHAFSASVVKR